MKRYLNYILCVCVLGCFTLLAGCNTVEGFGKDMQQGGKKVQQTANRERG